MTRLSNTPQILLTTYRNNVQDCSYYGSVYIANTKSVYFNTGFKPEHTFFMRSLAKPLQASVMCDCNITEDFKLKNVELAVMSASHSGSPKHIAILKELMKRFKIKYSDLELEAILPLDTRKFKGKPAKLHNNCSGKHIMMILMCKYLGFKVSGYTNENHPLQKLIKAKQEELSGEYNGILSYDGCSTPLWSISANGIIRAYFNLFSHEKYSKIIKPAIKYPDIFGGYDRLDSDLIKLGKGNIYSKVGANGFVIVYNFNKNEILLLKLTQNNNPVRKLIVSDLLNKLGWLNCTTEEYEYNQKKVPVAKYCYEINLK